MKLDRHNYEEYFILYLDNELGGEERRQVEAFASENPDLKAELDILLQTRLIPDTDIIFEDKASLLVSDDRSINIDNYEEWLLSYIDKELSPADTLQVEKFVAGNAAAAAELALLQRVKLQPEAISFPDKTSLYRKEETKVVSIRWWRIAVAAALLIAIATTAIITINRRETAPGHDVANAGPGKKQSPVQKSATPARQPVTPLDDEEPAIVSASDDQAKKPAITDTPKEQTRGIAAVPGTNRKTSKEKIIRSSTDPETGIAGNGDATIRKIEKNLNGLPAPDQNPNVVPALKPAEEVIAKATNRPSPELTIPKKKIDDAIVTAGHDESLDPVEEPEGKKNKLRGFFRKVTRTFEKRTNMKATDDEDRLLIAGLAIKLN